MNSEELLNTFKELQKNINKLNTGPLSYYLECLAAAYSLLINKYAPFKRGDKVILIKEIDFVNDAPGWASSKHFLKPGARGVVECVSVHSSEYLVISVIFDNETYIDLNGKEQPVTKKHTYCFRDNNLVMDYDQNNKR